jgi:hypothetical protein
MSGHGTRKFNSVAVVGTEGTAFEATDAPAKVVIYSLGIVGALAAFGFALMFGYDKYLESTHPQGSLPSPLAPARILAPSPQIERLPWLDLPVLRAHEQEVLNQSGKDAEGRIHIPIGQAIDAMAAKLDNKPGAPVGLTTSGGQDMVFSHGLADMPPAYQQAQSKAVIQGEIHKNAQ